MWRIDLIGLYRVELMAQVEDVLKIAQRDEAVAENQIGLFGELRRRRLLAIVAERPSKEKLKAEKDALGFYITAHPLDPFEREVRKMSPLTSSDLPSVPDGSQVVPGGSRPGGQAQE